MEMDKVYTSESPDPVAERAAKYALEVTDVKRPHPWANKFGIIFAIILIIIGTFGAVIGTINTISVHDQNKELKKQQGCQAELLRTISIEQKARADIAADDRNAVDDLVRAVSKAKTAAEVNRAFDVYNSERKLNDIRRNQYPVPLPSKDVCSHSTAANKPANTNTGPVITTPGAKKSSTAAKASVSLPNSTAPDSVSVPAKPNASRSAGATRPAPAPVTRVRTVPVRQPGQTTVRTVPVTVVSTPTPAPLPRAICTLVSITGLIRC